MRHQAYLPDDPYVQAGKLSRLEVHNCPRQPNHVPGNVGQGFPRMSYSGTFNAVTVGG